MHIAFVNSTRKWGGVKTWTVDYVRELIARGHTAGAYARQEVFVEALRGVGAEARRAGFGFDFNPVSIGRFMAAFRRTRPDVVVCNVGKDMNIGGVAARLLGIPVIQRVGMPRDMVAEPKLVLLLKFIRPWMLCPSRSVANGVLKELPFIPRERVKIIRNAKRPAAVIRPVQPGPLKLISTSQVNHDKGHAFVLDALETFPAGSFRYDVVGTGGVLDALRERYRAMEARGDLFWHGFSTEVAEHLAGADVFLLPSMSEGMPNSLLEAMAAGLIPVSRDIGGVREIWPDSLDDFLVETEGGAEAFRVRLERLLAMEPARLDGLKRASLDACRSGFNLVDRVDEFERWVRRDILGG
ncbi:MAG: glycosyltransferase [Pseudodesulfovibrio sp.]|uniref:glycosyltransferase n=1 Tax=Pseudodesulfovibrio sp. TaxID=2035812 RepID=UPI003D098128